MTENKYLCKQRDFDIEKAKYQHEFKATIENPLNKLNNEIFKKAVKKEDKIIRKAKVYNDPLSEGLREIKNKKTSNEKVKENEKVSVEKEQIVKSTENAIPTHSFSFIYNENFVIKDEIEENWNDIKGNLIKAFCTNDDLIVKSLFTVNMNDDDLQANYKIDIGRTRLEELEKESKGEFNFTTSKEYVSRLESLKKEMIQKWNNEDKVGAIKIMIHCTKILNDTSTPKFYCHKFIIITDILETFANLIFQRIFKISFPNELYSSQKVISPILVSNKAKDICSNWIYKCSCIRELLPRIYVDIIFLKIMCFMKSEFEIEQSMITIARKISGISHPLISFYLSAFFCKVVMTLYPKNKSFILFLLELLTKYNLESSLIKKFNYENLNIEEFIKLIEPCYEWLVYCLSKSANEDSLNLILSLIERTDNIYILNAFIIHFPSKYVLTTDVLDKIFKNKKLSNNLNLPLIFAHKILSSNTTIDLSYINILTDTLFNLTYQDPSRFIEGATLLGEILLKFYSEETQDIFFDKVLSSFKQIISKSIEKTMIFRFEKFLITLVKKMNNSNSIMNIENFLLFIDNFNNDLKLSICNTIIKQVLFEDNKRITDPYTAYILLKINKYIHDLILYNKKFQETRENIISDIELNIIQLIKVVDFGYDYETYFNFLGEIRASIFEVNSIIEILLYEVEKICYSTYAILKGKHNKKSLRFIKVCLAFIQITIPTLKNTKFKINHLIISAEIALANNLISESDSLIKNAMNLLSEMFEEGFKSQDDIYYFKNTINKICSMIIVVPSNPDTPFQLVEGIINIFENKNIHIELDYDRYLIKLSIFYSAVKTITSLLQMKLPYHILNIDSNDEMFIGEESYTEEGNKLINKLIEDILEGIAFCEEKKLLLKTTQIENLALNCYEIASTIKKYLKVNKLIKSVATKMKLLADDYYDLYSKKKDNSKIAAARLKNYKVSFENSN